MSSQTQKCFIAYQISSPYLSAHYITFLMLTLLRFFFFLSHSPPSEGLVIVFEKFNNPFIPRKSWSCQVATNFHIPQCNLYSSGKWNLFSSAQKSASTLLNNAEIETSKAIPNSFELSSVLGQKSKFREFFISRCNAKAAYFPYCFPIAG